MVILYIFLSNCIANKQLLGECLSERIITGRSYEDCNVNINNCFFARFDNLNSNGGVILITTNITSLSIIECVFSGCKVLGTSLQGGAINAIAKSSTMKMVCAHNCSSTYYGQFCYIESYLLIEFDYLTITTCLENIGYYTILSQFGDQKIQNSNISSNVGFTSGFAACNTEQHMVIYCTFANNHPYNSLIIRTYGGVENVRLSNIISNTSPKGYSIASAGGSSTLQFNECIFLYNMDTLFSTEVSSKINVNSCIISHSGLLTSGAVSQSHNQFTITPSYKNTHYSTFMCAADVTAINRHTENRKQNIHMYISLYLLHCQ